MKRDTYKPGPAAGASVEKDGDKWTLVLVRELRHPPAKVWTALTDPAHVAQWAPFDVDRDMAQAGPATLTLINAPQGPQTFHSTVKRAEAPTLLEYTWGNANLRWQLEPHGAGTRLTLWHNIDKGFITWGAAGWHICLDVLDHALADDPIGRIVGKDAMQFDWQRLVNEYAQHFGVAK